ncbi:MAG: response regulator [Bdellovibrionaceae bacterium]|nr:response regulator [Pseudobdellovibrionaceae bacterium]
MKNTILLVEDNQDLLELIGEMLQFANFKVLLAPNGKEAMQLLEKHSAEIILLITDLVMPKMSGHELALWASKHYPEIPCLKISGSYDAPHGAGPEEFLEKPFTEKQLLVGVRVALQSTVFRIAL